ncbi:MAG: hypothetical protein JWM25_1209 [Thermoleophilia bacterium]|nr:hypothetical protein [Thermoleophilia bacterium]MCZ4496626.1 hypothetical protein [Thermoleophilia bacterium]
MSDELDLIEPPTPQRPPISPQQRSFLRRILVSFVVVVVLLPLTGLGDAWTWLLIPMLGAAAFGLVSAVRLRRSVRRVTASTKLDQTN